MITIYSIFLFKIDKSSISRQIYTFHIIEMDNSEYSEENW